MKRSLVLIPFILLVVLSACSTGEGNAAMTATLDWNAFSQAQTATAMPTPTVTPTPDALSIKYSMNSNDPIGGGESVYLAFDAKLFDLEDAIGADFKIMDIRFPLFEGGPGVIFEVHARCECADNAPCCSPEHMFVLTIRRLYLAGQRETIDSVRQKMPTFVQELQVVCYDHRNEIDVISVPWSDVQSFVQGTIDGDMLGARVTPGP